MVCLAGDNNLAEEMIFALKSMFTIGSTDDVQVVAWSDSVGSLVPFDIKKHDPITLGVKFGKEAPAVLLVSEDNDLKEKQEKFLTKKDKFAIKFTEEQIDEDLANIVDVQEEVLLDREKLGDKNVGKARKAHLKIKNAIKESKESVLLRAKMAQRVLAAKTIKQNSSANSNSKQSAGKGDVDEIRLTSSAQAAETPVADLLTNFIFDSIERYPADRYALILSGHGSGAVGDFLTSDKQFFSLSIPSLCEALETVQEGCDHGKRKDEPWLDLLGFDSCLMSMAEVAYQVKDSVKYMVAAEGFETATGWPYDRVIALLHRNPKLDPRTFASQIVDEHLDYYSDYTTADISVDLSAISLKKMDALVEQVGPTSAGKKPGFATLLKEGLGNDAIKDAIVLAHWEAQGYKSEQYADLWDFCECLSLRLDRLRTTAASQISKACRQVQAAIDEMVLRSGYRGAEFQHSHGVSVFFPWADLKDAAERSEVDHYGLLAFAINTQWDEFLREYFRATIRQSRNPDGKSRRSFMNCRPFLFTGEPEKPEAGHKTPPYTFRTPPYTFRTPPYTFRTPPYTFRTPPYTFRTPPYTFRMSGGGGMQPARIASMKNPPIDWFE